MRARLRLSFFAQPEDFLLLRLTLERTEDTDNVGFDDMALRGANFVSSLSSLIGNFGCVGHYVDQNLLSLAGAARQPPASRSPPDHRFAPPISTNQHKQVRVVQLWGLRHCVLAARKHLVGVLSGQMDYALPLGGHAVRLARDAFASEEINVPGVSSSVGVPRSKRSVRCVLRLCVRGGLATSVLVHSTRPWSTRRITEEGSDSAARTTYSCMRRKHECTLALL